jgi:hypothetical protein
MKFVNMYLGNMQSSLILLIILDIVTMFYKGVRIS